MSNVAGWLPNPATPWAGRSRFVTPPRAEHPAVAARDGERFVGVFGEAAFRGVVARERSRATRFNEPLALLVVEAPGNARSSVSAPWQEIVEALDAATRSTDILGWVEHGTVLGAVLPELAGAEAASRAGVERRLRRELAARLPAGLAASLPIALHVYDPATLARSSSKAAEGQPLAPRRAKSAVRDGVKRVLDIVGSLLLLLLLSPVFVVLAALVKLTSPGPVFYRQARVGQDARPFTMLKFRSMRTGADHAVHQRFVTNFIKAGAHAVGAQGIFKLTNDPRVTPVGRILRRTSLDELPQFWNVLRGEMSLVGPRPPLAYELEQYQPWHLRRVLDAKPGVTGLWQVTGRSRTTFDEMVRLDLRYARSRGLWTDVRILLKTPAAVIAGKGAC